MILSFVIIMQVKPLDNQPVVSIQLPAEATVGDLRAALEARLSLPVEAGQHYELRSAAPVRVYGDASQKLSEAGLHNAALFMRRLA
jgi:hypothetical protein